nr:tetratricopeptide repeat protein [uncultured Brevundimonas sp.]
MRTRRLGLLCGLSMGLAIGLAAGSAMADPQTDEANRQRQMASMRQEAARADQASADRSLTQQQNAANAALQGPNSGMATGAGSSSSGAPTWAGGSSAGTGGPQSVVDSYTFTFRVQETTPQMLARLTAAADGGDGGAAYNLARIYYTGFEGVPRDDAAARRLFGQAARIGHAQSQASYGFFLKEGIGGPTEPQEARRWLKAASDAGNSFGQMQYAFSLWSEDPEAASPLLIAAADAGEMGAQALLGSLYVMGYAVAQDDVLAVKYLKAAAEQGEPGSKGLLAGLYLTGRGGGSEAEGYRLLKEGADGGDADSMRNYGLMLVQGKGYPKDPTAGAAIVRKAAVAGDAKSQKLLGDLYNEGLGVPEHEEDTIYWWNRAAEAGDAEAIEAMADVRAGGYVIGRAPLDGVGETASQAGRGK